MAQYKVIQDIEAEDKLVGPLTLRQFIYAGIAAVCLYICFLSFSKGVPFLIGIFLPVAAVAGFFAFPWKGEQPTEIWALARARYMLKPRVRIWDQDGAKDMVTIIAPKKVMLRRSSKEDMTQTEVRSRLKALADTIDSRGWATRNAAYGVYNQQWNHPSVAPPVDAGNPLAAMIPNDDMFDDHNSVAQNFDAMLDKSQTAQRERVMQQMDQAQNPQVTQPQQMQQPQYNYTNYAMPQLPSPIMPTTATPQQQMQQMPDPALYAAPATYQAATAPMPMPLPQQQTQQSAQAQPAADYWFANGPAYPVNPAQQTQSAATAQQDDTAYRIESDIPLAVAATPTPDEYRLGEELRQQNQAAMAINYGHMRVLQPSSDPYAAQNPGGIPIDYQGSSQFQAPVYSQQPDPTGPAPSLPQPVTRTPDPAILDLANNDDLDIATIARQAKREIDKSPDEVEIRLH